MKVVIRLFWWGFLREMRFELMVRVVFLMKERGIWFG